MGREVSRTPARVCKQIYLNGGGQRGGGEMVDSKKVKEVIRLSRLCKVCDYDDYVKESERANQAFALLNNDEKHEYHALMRAKGL